jgi:hypothetical protein
MATSSGNRPRSLAELSERRVLGANIRDERGEAARIFLNAAQVEVVDAVAVLPPQPNIAVAVCACRANGRCGMSSHSSEVHLSREMRAREFHRVQNLGAAAGINRARSHEASDRFRTLKPETRR